MRKLLLATVAALGASMWAASYADAQIVDDTDGQSYPTPGQITVRLNGRFRFYAGVVDSGALRTSNFGVANSTSANGNGVAQGVTASVGGTQNQGTNRLANYGFSEYARLYPGFDGVAANGLKYGASLEIRQDNNYGAGGGAEGSITGLTRSRGQLYFRRTFGYIGTDRLGTVRVGSTDQPSSLYLTGTFETFDDGGLDGDLPGFLPNGGIINWPFNDVGNMYTTNKAVYLSPQFYGVDFGVSYEPSTAAIGDVGNAPGCNGSQNINGQSSLVPGSASVATPGCDELASTSTGDIARRRNTYEALVRYRGTFGPVGIAATASYMGSGRVLDSGVVGSTTNPKRKKLEDRSYGDFGLVLTYGGLSFGGNYQVGRYTVQGGGSAGGLLTQGQPNSNAGIVGATYTIGPVIFGAHGLMSWYQGNQTAATNANALGASVIGAPGTVTGGQRRDVGVGAGATYSLAPGVSLYASYIWEEARQRGFNLYNGSSNVGLANDVHNKLDGSVFAVGTSFAW